MDFDSLKQGELVRFTPRLAAKMSPEEVEHDWSGEPLNCILVIEKAVSDYVMLGCTGECGSHSIDTLSRHEYNYLSRLLGQHLLEATSVSEFLSRAFSNEATDFEYDPDEAAEEFFSLLTAESET